jgi:hypothetical protein
LRKPAEPSVERLHIPTRGEREHQWVSEVCLDVLDEARANARALKLWMNEDVDQVGVVNAIANGLGKANEAGTVEGERLSNTSRKRELNIIRDARLPSDELKESRCVVPRDLRCIVVDEHGVSVTGAQSLVLVDLPLRTPLLPTAWYEAGGPPNGLAFTRVWQKESPIW